MAPPPRPPKPLSQDDITRTVIQVQTQLYLRGYDVGVIDGQLGEKTRAALRAFQNASGLVENGNMDPEVLSLLGITPRARAPASSGPN